MPTLEILSGSQAGKTFSFSESAKVGKDETCLVRINDAGVSRFHAQIVSEGGAIHIEDLGSSNGTYVNFKKRGKGERAALTDRDIVFFGRTVSKYWADAPPEGGVSIELLRETVPFKGLTCPGCSRNLEADLAAAALEAERVEVLRRLRLHELDPASLQKLLAKAR